ncbi:MlaC/ttg2D family ABC transporter substrate-binding protein [Orrella sp. JC864]|uniref:MlaC/ttg2D family ABC transporter substrate-binding protein n=1 Tax=Orrella sp. JC864 TaxID=3120298 RepID=UPI003FA689C7
MQRTQGLDLRMLMLRASLALLLVAGMIGLARAQAQPDPKAAPNEFVQQVADQLLDILKKDAQLRSGDIQRVNQVVDQNLLPYVNFERTTRLAAGRNWRQATPEQQQALAQAFRGTLIRTYSGALTKVDQGTSVRLLPFRGDPNADDVVVRSQIVPQSNAQPVGVDYRLEKTPEGWKIYDLNVEGIWLIENYRNQFAQEINRSGIDGLIQALNSRNQ